MSTKAPPRWIESLFARLLVLAPVVTGIYAICMRLPGYLDPTPLTDFPIVTTLIAIFAFLTVVHWVLDGVTAIARRMSA